MFTVRTRRRISAHSLALQAAVALVLASLRIRMARRERLVAMLGDARAPESSSVGAPRVSVENESALAEARRVGRMVQRVARALPWHPTCLRQALATQWLLRRRSISSVLHLGVAQASTMDAHAWVTVDGWYVVGRVARSFAPVASFER